MSASPDFHKTQHNATGSHPTFIYFLASNMSHNSSVSEVNIYRLEQLVQKSH